MSRLLRPKRRTTSKPSRSNMLTVPNQIPTARGFVAGYASTIPPPCRPIDSRAECSARLSDALPTGRPVHEEAGDPPAREPVQLADQRTILPPPVDPGQLFPKAVLTPTDRNPSKVHENAASVSAPEQLPVVASVLFLPHDFALRPIRASAVVEHAPAAGLHSVVLPEQGLEIAPSGGSKVSRFEHLRSGRRHGKPEQLARPTEPLAIESFVDRSGASWHARPSGGSTPPVSRGRPLAKELNPRVEARGWARRGPVRERNRVARAEVSGGGRISRVGENRGPPGRK